jgi:hypothetical protein
MKSKILIPILSIITIAVLFFFPNPEENFLAYSTTAVIFIILLAFLISKSKKK